MGYKLTRLGTLIDAVAGSAVASLRTTTVQVSGFETNRARKLNGTRLRWTLDLDYTAATAVTIDPYVSLDGGTTYGRVQSQAVSAGVAALSDYQQSNALAAADETFDGWIDVIGATHARLIVGCGAVADTMTLIAVLVEATR